MTLRPIPTLTLTAAALVLATGDLSRVHAEEPKPDRVEVRRCIGVIDGDTITVAEDGKPQGRRVRLRSISAPENDAPFAVHAYRMLRDQVLGKDVRLTLANRTSYKRLLAYVDYEYEPGQWGSAGAPLVRAGYAWVSAYPDSLDRYDWLLEIERDARLNGRGIWAPTPPR